MKQGAWGMAAWLAAAQAHGAAAQADACGERGGPRRPVATYSIVAFDPATRQLGVAVQSHWFSVGPIVPWAEAGVGAVATQSLVEVSYGPLGLELMRAGKSAPEALKALLAADGGAAGRQVAMVDAAGRVAVHTGQGCIPAAGSVTGATYACQANLMLEDTVWGAMARAYETASGDLAGRMLAALDAAEAEGGDLRGRQSAAILVVSGTPTGRPWQDRLFDLRVEDHPAPLAELRRLVGLARAYRSMNEGDERSSRGDTAGALSAYREAHALAPEVAEVTFWTAATMVSSGQVDEGLALLRRAFAQDPGLRILPARLAKVGLFPSDPALLERVGKP